MGSQAIQLFEFTAQNLDQATAISESLTDIAQRFLQQRSGGDSFGIASQWLLPFWLLFLPSVGGIEKYQRIEHGALIWNEASHRGGDHGVCPPPSVTSALPDANARRFIPWSSGCASWIANIHHHAEPPQHCIARHNTPPARSLTGARYLERCQHMDAALPAHNLMSTNIVAVALGNRCDLASCLVS